MAEKLVLKTNVPEDIALAYPDGRHMTGDYGDSMMYTLADGRVWFAPMFCAHKITELQIGVGEMFRVCKAEVREKGNKRGTIRYEISRVVAEPPAALTAATVTAAPRAVPPASSKPTNPVSPNGHDAAVETLFRSLCVAADALAKLGPYTAKKHGWETQYNEANILQLGCTVYINAQKAAGREGSQSWAA